MVFRLKLRTKLNSNIKDEEIEKREIVFEENSKSLVVKDTEGNLIRFRQISDSEWESNIWWDDIPMNVITNDLKTEKFSFNKSETPIYFFKENGKVWVKVDLPKGSVVKVKIVKTNNETRNNPYQVFFFYEDFTKINSIDTSKWYVKDGYELTNEGLKLTDKQGLMSKSKFNIHNFVIESVGRPVSTGNRGSFCRIADKKSNGFVSDGYEGIVDILIWSDGYLYAEWPRGEEKTKTYNTNFVTHRIVEQYISYYYYENDKLIYYTSPVGMLTGDYHIFIYSGKGTMYVKWIRLRKHYLKNQVEVNVVSSGDNYIIYEIRNTGNEDLGLVQIPLNNPFGDNQPIEVYVNNSIPDIKVPVLSKNVENNRTYIRCQVPHRAVIPGELHFHIHTLIPDISYVGKKVHLKLKLIGFTTQQTYDIKEIEKVFEIPNIPENELPKEVILDFGKVYTIDEISEIILGYLERLDSPNDTLPKNLPILFADFHYMINTPGSKTEFNK